MSSNDTFRLGFRFAESKRWKGATATSKVRPFLNHFNECDVVLDVGCGVGIELNAVSTRVKYSVGLDIDLSSLRAARHFLGDKAQKIDFVRADICYLPFKTSSFSKLFCFDVLEHISFVQEEVINGLKGVLCSEGECLIRVPNKWTLEEFLLMIVSKLRRSKGLWNVRHVAFFSLKEIVELFLNDGFSYVDGYTAGSLVSNILTSILTIASVPLNILFHNNYYKCRYYFGALCRFHPRINIFFVRRAFPKMPSFNYFTIVFRHQ